MGRISQRRLPWIFPTFLLRFQRGQGGGERTAAASGRAPSHSHSHHGALADYTTCPVRAAVRLPAGVRFENAAAALPGGWPALWVLRSLGLAPDVLPSSTSSTSGTSRDPSPPASAESAAVGCRRPVVVLAGLTAATAAALELCLCGRAAGGVGASLVILVGGADDADAAFGAAAWPNVANSASASAAAFEGEQEPSSSSSSSTEVRWIPSHLQDRADRLRWAPPAPGTSGDEGGAEASGAGGDGGDFFFFEAVGGGSGPPGEVPHARVSADPSSLDELDAEHAAVVDAVLDLTVRSGDHHIIECRN